MRTSSAKSADAGPGTGPVIGGGASGNGEDDEAAHRDDEGHLGGVERVEKAPAEHVCGRSGEAGAGEDLSLCQRQKDGKEEEEAGGGHDEV